MLRSILIGITRSCYWWCFIVKEIFSWHWIFGIDNNPLNTAVYLDPGDDHVPPLMNTVQTSSADQLEQDNETRHHY